MPKFVLSQSKNVKCKLGFPILGDANRNQQLTKYQQFCSGTGSGSAINFSGLLPVPVEKCKNIAGLPTSCCKTSNLMLVLVLFLLLMVAGYNKY
jgi:hypothetical protein